jgi:hypothetical protein
MPDQMTFDEFSAEMFRRLAPSPCVTSLREEPLRRIFRHLTATGVYVRAVLNGREQMSVVPMLLFCPRCRLQHVDAPQPEKNWTNQPHRSHECQGCGHVWRPSDTYTTGVANIATKGKADGYADPLKPDLAPLRALVERWHGLAVRGFGHPDGRYVYGSCSDELTAALGAIAKAEA